MEMCISQMFCRTDCRRFLSIMTRSMSHKIRSNNSHSPARSFLVLVQHCANNSEYSTCYLHQSSFSTKTRCWTRYRTRNFFILWKSSLRRSALGILTTLREPVWISLRRLSGQDTAVIRKQPGGAICTSPALSSVNNATALPPSSALSWHKYQALFFTVIYATLYRGISLHRYRILFWFGWTSGHPHCQNYH